MALGLIVCGVGGRMGGAVVRAIHNRRRSARRARSINLAARDWEKTPAKFPQLDISAFRSRTNIEPL